MSDRGNFIRRQQAFGLSLSLQFWRNRFRLAGSWKAQRKKPSRLVPLHSSAAVFLQHHTTILTETYTQPTHNSRRSIQTLTNNRNHGYAISNTPSHTAKIPRGNIRLTDTMIAQLPRRSKKRCPWARSSATNVCCEEFEGDKKRSLTNSTSFGIMGRRDGRHANAE